MGSPLRRNRANSAPAIRKAGLREVHFFPSAVGPKNQAQRRGEREEEVDVYWALAGSAYRKSQSFLAILRRLETLLSLT